jgi:chemotaxis protein MotB
MPEDSQAIIVIKKKVMGAGHHGGAWKVAYADFVTAMMAFFMVMWLVGSSEEVKQSVAGYFNDPSGSGKESGSGMSGAGQSITMDERNMDQLKDKLEQAMKEMPDFQTLKDQVKMTVTGEGLRVELMETEKGMFFDSGSPDPSKNGQQVLAKLAGQLSKMENSIMIEGHTDSRPMKGRDGYSNWELSGDRANAARRFMQSAGLRADQVKQVRGFADQALMNKDEPGAAKNRRVSIIVQYNKPKPRPEEEKMGEHGDAKGHGEVKAEGHPEAKPDEHKAAAKPEEHQAAAKPEAHSPEHAAPAKAPEAKVEAAAEPDPPKKKRRRKKAEEH